MSEKSLSTNQPQAMDLFDLFALLKKNSKTFFIIVMLSMLLGGLVILLSTKQYQSVAYVKKPSLENIKLLRLASSDNDVLLPETVFEKFINKLKEHSNLLSWYQEDVLPNNEQNGKQYDFKMLESIVKVKKNYAGKNNITLLDAMVSVTLSKPILANKGLKQLLRKTNERLVKEIVLDINSKTEQEIAILKRKIEALRESYYKKLSDQEAKLSESLRLAKALGIIENQFLIAENKTIQLSINQGGAPDYYRGVKSLTEEIKSIKRKKSDSFIPGLRDLQSEVYLLKKKLLLAKDVAQIQTYQIDVAATLPKKPIKPKKLLILALSITLGSMLAVFFILIRAAYQKKRYAGF